MDNLIEQSMLCDVDDHGEAVTDTLEVYTMLNPNTQYTFQATQPGYCKKQTKSEKIRIQIKVITFKSLVDTSPTHISLDLESSLQTVN